MLLQCLKCWKKTDSKNPKVAKTKKEKVMILSKCGIIKNQDLSNNKKLMGYYVA